MHIRSSRVHGVVANVMQFEYFFILHQLLCFQQLHISFFQKEMKFVLYSGKKYWTGGLDDHGRKIYLVHLKLDILFEFQPAIFIIRSKKFVQFIQSTLEITL